MLVRGQIIGGKERTLTLKNALIDGYLQISNFSRAVNIFLKTLMNNMPFGYVTFSAVIQSSG